MENIIWIIIVVLYLVSIVYCAIQGSKVYKELNRNSDVFSYRLDLIYRCFPDVDLLEKIVHKYTYEEMLQSSKPLEDSYWFTPEEIEEINNNISRKMIAYTAEKIKSNDF